jgi:hypothetical protein
MEIVEVGYNQQIVVDGEHHLIVSTEVINERDTDQLYPMLKAANELLESKHLKCLADKGYHTGAQLSKCEEYEELETYVAPLKSKNGPEGFRKQDFTYEASSDTYTCPQGETLSTNGRWYKKNEGKHRRSYRIKRYTLTYAKCANCPFVERCNKGGLKSRHGRYIERTEHDGAIAANAARVAANKELYRRRQAIVEHPFGTIKRGWGYTYYLLKGLEKVNGEGSLIALVYNLRRSVSILGVRALVERLKGRKKAPNSHLRVVSRQDACCLQLKWARTG